MISQHSSNSRAVINVTGAGAIPAVGVTMKHEIREIDAKLGLRTTCLEPTQS